MHNTAIRRRPHGVHRSRPRNVRIDAEKLDSERPVVRNEMQASENRPQQLPFQQLMAAIALCYAGLCCEGLERNLRRASRLLARELERQILADGGHASRNPRIMVDLLFDLLPLRQMFASREVDTPDALLHAIDRMLPMVRLFRHGDGTLSHFNGMGVTAADHLATLLTYDDMRSQPIQHAPHSGYERLEAGRSLLVADVGAPPPRALSQHAAAGCLQGLAHLVGALKALERFFGAGALKPLLHGLRRPRRLLAQRRQRQRADTDQDVAVVGRVVGKVTRQHVEQAHAERIQICAVVDAAGAAHLLGAHEQRRAEHGAGLRRALLALAVELGDAEVEHLGDPADLVVFALDQEDVGRLQVAVNDALRMRARQRPADMRDDAHGVAERNVVVALESLLQRLALEKLEHDVRIAFGGLAVVVHLHHVPRAELGRRLGLHAEALACFGRLQVLTGDELDGDALAQRDVHRPIDGAHRAPSNLFFETVLTGDDESRSDLTRDALR